MAFLPPIRFDHIASVAKLLRLAIGLLVDLFSEQQ